MTLNEIARSLVVPGKGILAADQSPGTMDKQLTALELTPSAELRRQYRQLLFTTEGIEEFVTGVILHDGTIRNYTDEKVQFVDLLISKGVVPIIKVDKSTVPHSGYDGEVVTHGLDDLGKRFAEYYNMGARAAKWRAVFNVSDKLPSEQNIVYDCMTMTRYAAMAQEAGIVPIVEPEVIYSGDHSLERAEEVTTFVIQKLFELLEWYGVDRTGLILKSSMVLAGSEHTEQTPPEQVAEATLRTFENSVPKDVPGIVFLSGGQTPDRATENLAAIATAEKDRGGLPWELAFSFSRGIELPVQETWKGEVANVSAAQTKLLERLKLTSDADKGVWKG